MPIFGKRKQTVTRAKETNPSSADQRSIIITSREEDTCRTGRNFILSRESEDTAEPNAGGMFANGLQRVRFANDHGEARCPMCAGSGIYHNTPQPVAPLLLVVPPAPVPLQYPTPGYPPYYYVANNAGVLYGAAAAAPQVSMTPRPIIDTSTITAVVGNHPEEGKKKRETGRYYVWEENYDSKGRFWRHYYTGEWTREDPYV